MLIKANKTGIVRVLSAFLFGLLGTALVAEESLPVLIQFKSQPTGYLEQQSAVEVGTQVTTPQIDLEQYGHAFAYWSIGEGPIGDSLGNSLIAV